MIVGTLAIVAGLAVSAFAGAARVEPELLPGAANKTCGQFEGSGQDWTEFKVDPNADGTFSDGTLTVTITHTQADKVFSWSSNIGVDSVVAKGGSDGSYLYRYDPPQEATSDSGLTTPGQNSISHISFCYDVAPRGSLRVIKHVVNDNGGSADADDWTMNVAGPTPLSFPGAESPGTTNAATVGSYTVTESGGPSGYALTYSGDCDATGNVTVTANQTSTCTLTNDDTITNPGQPARLIVIKHVINDNGGTATASDFRMTINGVTAQGGNSFAGAAAPGVSKTLASVGAYNVTEAAVAGYTQTAASADCQGTIALGQTKTCTITNNDNPPTVTSGLGSIDVQKSAGPTSVKEPGGAVNFTVTVTNTSNVSITVTNVVDSVFGDLDDDGGSGVFDVPINLPPGASVSKTFQRQVTGTADQVHRNVVTASGIDNFGNSFSDSDDAVVQITPRLIDLVIVKDASSPTPLNEIVNYTLTVSNKGPDTATNVQVADPAPAGIRYVSVNTPKGTCNLTGSLITCSLGNLAAGERVVIRITARATAVGTHTNTATVTGGGGRETNPVDNVDDAVTIVPAPFVPPSQAKRKPQPVCLTLTVAPKMIKADGRPDRVSIKVTAGKKRVKGTKVSIFGAGVRKTGRSNANGMAFIKINPRKAGLITITAVETNQKVCGPKRIGVVGVFLPPLTG